jgi:hypothetical protein
LPGVRRDLHRAGGQSATRRDLTGYGFGAATASGATSIRPPATAADAPLRAPTASPVMSTRQREPADRRRAPAAPAWLSTARRAGLNVSARGKDRARFDDGIGACRSAIPCGSTRLRSSVLAVCSTRTSCDRTPTARGRHRGSATRPVRTRARPMESAMISVWKRQ